MFYFVELAPTFTANPPDSLYVLEGDNITFVWQYNLDGTFHNLFFRFISGSVSRTIVYKHDINVDAAVPENVYQGRIQENINATRAEITIFALQRSESAIYEIELYNNKIQSAKDQVTVQVQCKYTNKSFMNIISTGSKKFKKSFRKGESRFVVGCFISFILDANCFCFPGSLGI